MSDESVKDSVDAALREHGISLLIDAVATRSAKQAVNETFFLLGVDLADPGHVRSTRDVLTRMRDKFHSEERRKESWGKGIVHAVTTAAAGVVLAVGTYIVSGYWPAPWRQ